MKGVADVAALKVLSNQHFSSSPCAVFWGSQWSDSLALRQCLALVSTMKKRASHCTVCMLQDSKILHDDSRQAAYILYLVIRELMGQAQNERVASLAIWNPFITR